MYIFKRTSSSDQSFLELVRLLDMDLKIRDGKEHDFYAQFNKTGEIKNAMVCYEAGNAVGCGAFKPYKPHVAEIKRMYVRPEHRNNGIASQILFKLEEWAGELGYKSLILETGKKQPEAISLYKKSGYALIPNYGQYLGVDNSVCMQKDL